MNFSSLDLNLLRVLDALLSEGSTVRAADKVGLSQPAVSAALGRLRTALGDPLFVRRGQGLEPTDFARAIERPLREALDGLQSILSGVETFDPFRSTQTFRISGSDFYAEMLMPQLAETFAHIAPGVKVQLVDMLADAETDGLRDAAIDIALMPETTFPDWVGHQHLFDSPFAVIARRGHPAVAAVGAAEGDEFPLDLFCELNHVLFSPEGNLRGVGDVALDAVGRSRRVVMTLPVFSGVYNAVAESDLIALLPRQLAERVAARLNLSLYTPPMPVKSVRLFMIWHHRSTLGPASRWIRQQVLNILGPLHIP